MNTKMNVNTANARYHLRCIRSYLNEMRKDRRGHLQKVIAFGDELNKMRWKYNFTQLYESAREYLHKEKREQNV